jgi:2-polyprenyl-3-methyl-5-hydroxy-6-metoxy-1,4-benzoquinol methylase
MGVEYDARYAERLLAIAGENSQIIFGAFPQVTERFADEEFDCIIALDLLEHMEDGEALVQEIHRLLKKGGRTILMAPLRFVDGQFNTRFLHPHHVAIYSEGFIREWFCNLFTRVQFDRWIVGHEVIVADKA